jgi:hypothetical protein
MTENDKLRKEQSDKQFKAMINEMNAQLPDFRIMAEYEELVTRIDKAKFERRMILMQEAKLKLNTKEHEEARDKKDN